MRLSLPKYGPSFQLSDSSIFVLFCRNEKIYQNGQISGSCSKTDRVLGYYSIHHHHHHSVRALVCTKGVKEPLLLLSVDSHFPSFLPTLPSQILRSLLLCHSAPCCSWPAYISIQRGGKCIA